MDSLSLYAMAINLASGKRKSCLVGAGFNSSMVGWIGRIVVKPNGSLAWSGRTRPTSPTPSNGTPSGKTSVVAACDSRGERYLDTGEGIDLHSLALHGSTLTWTNSGEKRSAALN